MGPLATESPCIIVTAPARTGSDSASSRAVMTINHTNSGIRSGFILFVFLLIVVVIKFTAPRIEDTPANCSEKMALLAEFLCGFPHFLQLYL